MDKKQTITLSYLCQIYNTYTYYM